MKVMLITSVGLALLGLFLGRLLSKIRVIPQEFVLFVMIFAVFGFFLLGLVLTFYARRIIQLSNSYGNPGLTWLSKHFGVRDIWPLSPNHWWLRVGTLLTRIVGVMFAIISGVILRFLITALISG